MKTHWTLRSLVAIACLLMLTIGCDDDDSPTGNGGGGNGETADSLVTLANTMMGDAMDQMINQTMQSIDSSFRPRDIDFTSAHNMYMQALAADAANPHAKVGAAMTGMMIVLADDDLNTLYENIKDYIDDSLSSSLLPAGLPDGIVGQQLADPGLPTRPEYLGRVIPDPLKLQSMSIGLVAAKPEVSELQTVLHDVVLPRIGSAIIYFDDVIVLDTFEFVITADMQGNPGADPIVLDKTDFLVFKAVLHGIRAGVYVFLARDLDLPSYDVAGLQYMLQRSSAFGGLATGGADDMASAMSDILDAESAVQDAIRSLNNEVATGQSQLGDLITIDQPDDTLDLNEVADTIAYYRDFFNGPRNLMVTWTTDSWCYWDNELGWICNEIKDTLQMQVDIARIFTDPLNNPKQFLPDYTITLEDLSDYQALEAAHFSRTRFWNNIYTIYNTTIQSDAIDSINQYFYYGFMALPGTKTDEYYRILAEWPYDQLYTLGWDDNAVGNWCSPGTKDLFCYHSEAAELYSTAHYGGVLVGYCAGWVASDYAGWTWPDPTFNGLLPAMTNNELKELFFDDPNRWDQSDCDTLRFGF